MLQIRVHSFVADGIWQKGTDGTSHEVLSDRPRRHVSTYFDCTEEEKAALWVLVERVRGFLSDRNPDGFNVGFQRWNGSRSDRFPRTHSRDTTLRR